MSYNRRWLKTLAKAQFAQPPPSPASVFPTISKQGLFNQPTWLATAVRGSQFVYANELRFRRSDNKHFWKTSALDEKHSRLDLENLSSGEDEEEAFAIAFSDCT